jgi:8-oxo-dGTP pyrophosphatase MutT (NUDIX family)
MQVVYAKQPLPAQYSAAIFLAGPTPRDAATPSWRPEAIAWLESHGFDGVVFVPEEADGQFRGSYDDQVEWEREGLRHADVIVFWIPRELQSMPAFTTNVEFGRWIGSGKCVLGFPDGAPKMRYLAWLAGTENTPVCATLADTLAAAVARIVSAQRAGGERAVPLHVWHSPSFQKWYRALIAAGNRLDDADLLWSYRIRWSQQLFAWILKVKIWITAEQRHKSGEWVLARTDVSAVVLYRRAADPWDSEVVLVREFRSAARTKDGYVREFAGGSSVDESHTMLEVAADEVREETGLSIDASRLRSLGARQVSPTLSSHVLHAYAVELSDDELAAARALAQNETVIVGEGSERTVLVRTTLRELSRDDRVDWAMYALALQAVFAEAIVEQ